MIRLAVLSVLAVIGWCMMTAPTSTGATLSYTALEQLWINAGGAADKAPLAAAVAMAESGGRAVVSKPNSNGTVDVGYWQINSAHGSRLATLDPMGNARAAIQLSANGSNFRPWCTAWTNGCRGTYIPTDPSTPAGKQFAKLAGGGEVLIPNASAVPSSVSTNPLSGDFWTHVIDVVGNWMFYVSIILGGGILLFLGTFQLIRDTAAGRATVNGVSRAVQLFV